MGKTKTKDVIHISQESHQVKCKLTEPEKAAAALVLANAHQEQESLVIEKKAALGTFKQRVDKLAEQIHVTSLMVQSGFEIRSVLCELKLNYTTGRATVTRLDLPGGIVEEREMTDDEKQMQLPYTAKTGKNKTGKDKDTMQETVKSEQTQFEKARQEQQDKKDKKDKANKDNDIA